MSLLYYVPLTYFFRTRYYSVGLLAVLAFLNVGYCIVAISVSHCNLSAAMWNVCSYLVFWCGYSSIYELGYFLNDSWSARREQARGNNRRGAGHKRMLELNSRDWVWLVVSRIAVALAVFAFLANLLSRAQILMLAVMLTTMAVIFTAHNIIFLPLRCITYLSLYLMRYVICIPFLGDQLSCWALICISIPLALGSTAVYWGTRVPSWSGFANRNGIASPVITGGAVLVYLALYLAAEVFDFVIPLGVYIISIYVICVDLLARFASVAKSLLSIEGGGGVRFHAHSNYSHDSNLNLVGIRALAEKSNCKVIFMAEHKEDLNAERYQQYKAACMSASSENVMLIPGVEYNIYNQHVLGLGLESIIEISTDKPTSVIHLYRHAERIVWAHPTISIRRLYDIKYIYNTLLVGVLSEALEWENRKSQAIDRKGTRAKILCLVVCVIWPGRRLIRAEDAHNSGDYMRLKEMPAR